jgi:ABC-type uncharacterized transport system involved in gliding motility auxiliary subunit
MSKLGKISIFFAGLSLVSLSVILSIVGDWVPFCWLALGLSIFFTGLTLYWDRHFFREFASMKTTKEGMSMGVLISMVLALLIVVNYLGIKHSKTWDFSIAQANSLSPQSVQLVKGLTSDLKVLFFYKKGVEGNEENRRLFRELIKKYQDLSSQIHLEFVEVNERPDLSKDYGVDKGSGVVFLDYQGHRNRIEKIDEQEFTSALVKVTRTKNKNIYFVVGHGEKNLEDPKEALGMNSLKVMLENNSYNVKLLPLVQTAVVPADADVVIIAGPSESFQDFELNALEDHLKKGGSLFIALEPEVKVGLEKLLRKTGIALGNNYVVNVVDSVLGRAVKQGPTVGSVFSPSNLITKGFGQNEVTLFRYPQSINFSDSKELMQGLASEILVKTSPQAESFTDLSLKGTGLGGSYPLVSQVTGKWQNDSNTKSFSLIVAGDVDFMTNQMLYQNLNRDLILNSIAALAREENLISITAKEPQATQLLLTETKFSVFLFAFIIPFPLLLLGVSIGLYTKRRNA